MRICTSANYFVSAKLLKPKSENKYYRRKWKYGTYWIIICLSIYELLMAGHEDVKSDLSRQTTEMDERQDRQERK